MIKLPKLDDQKYTDIVEAAKRRIPVIFPEWTDFNEHDPGITIIELWAWLKEMQQYYLDRISDRSREAMLRLAGIIPRPAAPSAARLTFSGSVPEYLPAGSTAAAPDGTEFLLEKPFRKAVGGVTGVYLRNGSEYMDVTEIAAEHGTAFHPFGQELECAGRYLYIRLSAASDRPKLWFDIADRCPVARNPFEDESSPRDIVWEYSTAAGFVPCSVLSDSTHGLSVTGRISFGTGADMAASSVEAPAAGVWLRAYVGYSGCEDMPLLSGITADMLTLTQKKRECACEDMLLTDGFAECSDLMAAQGRLLVMLRDGAGWQLIPEPIYAVIDGRVRIDLTEYSGTAAADGQPNVRVIFYTEAFAGKLSLSSDGLPCQEFRFDPDGTPTDGGLRIMVMDRADSEKPRWREYLRTESMGLAGPEDRVFCFDEQRRKLVFGDNENGEAPPAGTDNILVTACILTKGADGNIPAGSLKGIRGADAEYPVSQPEMCFGGRSRESLEAALRRLRFELSDCSRAVSAEDMRTIALRTPGVRIADVKAIPFFDPDRPELPPEKLANTVTLAVLPYSRSRYPVPDERFLAAVKRHIDGCRLLTVDIRTAAPVYVKINIFAEIVCSTREVGQARASAEQALRNMFSVYGSDGRTHFGEPVSEAAVISGICSVEGVLTVKYLRLSAERADCTRTAGGIQIPPHAIACCGTTELVVTEL